MSEKREAETWRGCPAGELARMVGRVRRQDRRTFLGRAARGSAAIALLGVGGAVASQWLPTETMGRKGRLTCGRVVELMPKYAADELDRDLMNRVALHLANCPKCNAHYQRMVS